MSSAVYYEDAKPLPPLNQLMHLPQSEMYEAVQSSLASPEVFSQSNSQHSSTRTTPASSFSGASGGPTAVGTHYAISSASSSIDKCTCKSNHNRIPRPRNAFILFRQKYHQAVLDEDLLVKTNPEVSRELGRRWRSLPPQEKEHWNRLAEEEKANHAKRFPGYRYTPRRNGKKGSCPACRQKAAKHQQLQLIQQYAPMPPDALYGYVLPQQMQMMQQPQQLHQQNLPQPQNQPQNQNQTQAQTQHYTNFMAPMPAYTANPGGAGMAGMPWMVPQFQQFGFNLEALVPAPHQEKLSPLSSAVNATNHVSPFAHNSELGSSQFHYDNGMQSATSTSQSVSVPNPASVNVNLSNPPRFNSLPNNFANYAFETMMPHQP